MKQQTQLSIALALIVLSFASCNERAVPVDGAQSLPAIIPDAELIPLQPGNTWTYTRILYDSQGNEGSRETEQHTVQMAVEIDDEEWYQTDFAGFLTNRTTGVWKRMMVMLYGGERHFSFPSLFIPYPLEAGDSVKVSTLYTYKLLAKNVPVTVPAGTFICHHYRVNFASSLGGVSEYHRYYAPGVGFIKERWEVKPNSHEDSYENYSWYAGELLLEKAELK